MSRSIQPREPGSEPSAGMLRPGRSGWSDDAVRASLTLLAEALRTSTGFEVVTITVVDDQGLCENVAVAAPDDARSDLLGARVPLATLETLASLGRTSGSAHFVAEEVNTLEGGWAWCPDVAPADPALWHRMDWLGYEVRTGTGELVAVVQLDLPQDRLRPDEARLSGIDRACAMTADAIAAARERDRVSSRMRMATTARDVLRRCSGRQSIPVILDGCRSAVLTGFRAREMTVTLLDEDDRAGGTTVWPRRAPRERVPSRLLVLAERDARRGWAEQRVVIVDAEHATDGWLSAAEREDVLAAMRARGGASLLVVPVGSGPVCLGNLVLTRHPGDPSWNDEEVATALEIGHDLGQALAASRAFHREQELMTELRELDVYKSGLIATVSHEMRNPLTAVAGHLELLGSMREALPAPAEASLVAMARGTRRLERIIEDLLLFSKAGDPTQESAVERLDLREVVREVRDLHDLAAHRRDQHVTVVLPDEPVWVCGVPADLDCVVSNLVGNALKYSGEGSTVRLDLTQDAREVSLACADEGLGIAEEDLPQIFSEFYRSADPEVRRAGGTGLGLAIVSRIVTRHRGRVTVSSRVGEGSEFVLRLPSVEEFERRVLEAGLEEERDRRLAGESLV